ncbi:TPA: S-methyl-5-thioribose-1-phosphate isomerase [bacterium]|uniref:Methylthioribose-1-phosphate isomerase n=1 Tax=bacterium (Candidatus Ratteibacteria) CG15_BIG_FIL_POST_REV_8_21_14_020_41_12 TaxID=2014291 RepID=A0A2M7GXI9_9BACT|nr:MAG: S-methyl-5-thioribose-1-phosphate isomerase [bacterium (Candidatus Ratteibacteria) CG15_BIG_FIL_POST_REV_8_21_14_020_41_12]HCG76919.1 S-methyl-5-thioribose-1-phosphate isomerase [bacterium]
MIKTIDWGEGKIRIIDQTQLPAKLVYRDLSTLKQVGEAISSLKVRGAPAIGLAAALGVALQMNSSPAKNYLAFKKEVKKAIKYLSARRPTAINLFWGLERMQKVLDKNRGLAIPELKKILLKEALLAVKEDDEICRKIGRHGASLVKSGCNILTHCNAGGLATGGFGTALGVIFTAFEKGKRFQVYVDETRPLLQGARLTTWELKRYKIETTLICDNMAGFLMKQKKINIVIVGADRIASNGDTANKIGTYSLAILARAHQIPFYVAAPFSTFDLKIKNGEKIPIEERKGSEVTQPFAVRIAPAGIKVYNPAFDVTPASLITGIITEKGIIRPPLKKNIQQLLA